jgi:glyoxylase-like metal-dependent hydrolase (beta-lactamase superfamily II)
MILRRENIPARFVLPGRLTDFEEDRRRIRSRRAFFSPRLAFLTTERNAPDELLHFGAAHTTADTIAWLPKQKILVSGDIVVNGPYNAMWDAHVLNWIGVLAKVEALGANVVARGHGAPGPGSLVAGQRAYFVALREAAKDIIARGGDAKELRARVCRNCSHCPVNWAASTLS